MSLLSRKPVEGVRWISQSRAINAVALRAPSHFPSDRHIQAKLVRHGSSTSSSNWQSRQAKDRFAKAAKVQGLKSRAAFKLLEINEKYKVFRSGQTVVDLGYAPGSWSQVAVDRTSPNGRVVGIDIIPAQPPKGVSTLQGNFLSPAVQDVVKNFLREPARARVVQERSLAAENEQERMTEADLAEQSLSYLDREKRLESQTENEEAEAQAPSSCPQPTGPKASDRAAGRTVDVVLSDMSAPWAQTDGFRKRSLSNPYYRMMNTSGNPFRDHVGSMDLCDAALRFAFDMLRDGGHFVCKYYQGGEDKAFEMRLKALFRKVSREKPESSRSVCLPFPPHPPPPLGDSNPVVIASALIENMQESREGYFVALKRRADVDRKSVFPDG